MTPNEVLNHEFWQINSYLRGCRERTIRNEEDILKLAYQTASFNNSKKKPKKLDYYIRQLRKMVSGGQSREELEKQLERDKHNVAKLEEYYRGVE